MDNMDLTEKLHRCRSRGGLTYAAIAVSTCGSQANIRKIFTEGSEPKFLLGVALAKALGVSADWLGDPSRDWPPPASEGGRALEMVGEALERAGLLGEMDADVQELLRAYRALSPAQRAQAVGMVQGLAGPVPRPAVNVSDVDQAAILGTLASGLVPIIAAQLREAKRRSG